MNKLQELKTKIRELLGLTHRGNCEDCEGRGVDIKGQWCDHEGDFLNLEHVLKAIGKTDIGDFSAGVHESGAFNMCWMYETDNCGKEPKADLIQWQLGKPLKDQLQETIDFLHNLICRS